MIALLDMPASIAWLAVGICFAAGLTRGFTGFGLSAVIVASLAPFIPPIELIPVCWTLEMCAAAVLTRGGWQDSDRPTVLILTVAAALGLPIGLWITGTVGAEVSGVIALSAILVLSGLLLARLRLPWLATRAGTAVAGTGAGVISGVAGAGGLTIALYTLIRDLPARTMRGTLIVYMFTGGIVSLIVFLLTGVLTTEALRRAAVLTAPTMAGVLIGKALFTPRWEGLYKPACLVLLVALSLIGLLRLAADP